MVTMSNFNICKSNSVLIIVIVATSLTEVIALRQAEVLVNKSTFISCSSKEVKSIQWHHTPHGKKSNEYVYAGGRFYSPYNKGRFRVDSDLAMHMFTLVNTNVVHEDAGLYECKDDVKSGVFGSTYLTVLDSSPVCTSNMNPNGFAGPNTCNIKQENMTFSCAVSFSGNSPNLMWSTLNGNQSLSSSICESKDNIINCSLSMKAEPSFDGSTFICQTSNDARYNCIIEDIRVEYFFRDYEVAEKTVGDNATCVVESNLQIHYNWTKQQNNENNISSTNPTIYIQEPGFYKCSVKYSIRDVTCYAQIVAVYASNMVDDQETLPDFKETAAESSNVSAEQSIGLAIGLSIVGTLAAIAVIEVIAFFMYRKYTKGRRVSSLGLSGEANTTNRRSESRPLVKGTTSVIVPVHSTQGGNNVEEAEERIVNEMKKWCLENKPLLGDIDEDRLLAKLRPMITAVKKGESIVLFISCSTVEEFQELCAMVDNGEMKMSLEKLFNLLLHNMQTEVLLVTIYESDRKNAEKYFERELLRDKQYDEHFQRLGSQLKYDEPMQVKTGESDEESEDEGLLQESEDPSTSASVEGLCVVRRNSSDEARMELDLPSESLQLTES